MLAEFAERFTGSSDLYKDDDRTPTASINFITAHDGFTLNDLVSYDGKHNEANKEECRDGENHNRSWNCGAEGPTSDLEINRIRNRQKRNFLTTLFLSQGVPMLVAGDEFSRTQLGNNNAYCQDNEISWINWKEADQALLQFTQKLIHFNKTHPVFSRRRWFQGHPIKGEGLQDIAWFKPDGTEMTDENWKNDFAKSLAVYMNGRGIHASDWKGEPLIDDSFCIIFNAYHGDIEYRLPPERYGQQWIKHFDTTEDKGFIEKGNTYFAGDLILVGGLSVVMLIRPYLFETGGMDKSIEDAIHHINP
jgi:glycogen operon protein